MIHLSPPVIVVLTALLAIVALAALRARLGARTLAAIDAIAARPMVAGAICAGVPFAGSALVAWLVMWPRPVVHDEFSYLLAADTFAHGRLTNPTHPLWPFFESFHVFHQPTYASKYPPAQGLLLALGQVLGSPVIGVWLGAAALGAALYWMLRAWVAPRWAFLSALAAAMQLGITKYWTQTFWGGALAAAAGALVLGAVVRLARAPRGRDSLALGVGLLLLANTRPFEGLLLAIVALAYLGLSMRRRRAAVAATIGPVVAILFAGALALAWDDHVVTGTWWKLPYFNHEEIYAVKPLWIFQSARPVPTYRHYELCRFYKGSGCTNSTAATTNASTAPSTSASVSPGGAAASAANVPAAPRATPTARPQQKPRRYSAFNALNFNDLRNFFLGRVLLLPFVIGLWAVAQPPVLLAAASIGAMLLAIALSAFFQMHYVAPFAGAIFAIVAVGLERLERRTWRGMPVGQAVCAAVIAGVAGSCVLQAGAIREVRTSFGHDDFVYRRAELIEKLRATPGRDLVIVRYGPRHIVHHEWVYNGADIDGSDIVWARDMGAEQDRALLDYFRDRRVWLLKKGFSAEEDGLAAYTE